MVSAVALALAPSAAATEDEPNAPQSGAHGECIDYWTALVGLQVSNTAVTVAVEAATAWKLEYDPALGDVYVDFWDADGVWLDWTGGTHAGRVPDGAAYGTVCLSEWNQAEVPGIGALSWGAYTGSVPWTYQDGF